MGVGKFSRGDFVFHQSFCLRSIYFIGELPFFEVNWF